MKTTQEIQQLQLAVQSKLELLPEVDNFGYPTDEEREEMQTIVDELAYYLRESKCDDEAVLSWLEGPDEYYLADYLVEE